MIDISDEQFAALIDEVTAELPKDHMQAAQNVAVVYADVPTPEQREKLRLRGDQTLFGLYEGVPLTRRQGITGYPPDKITIFKEPMLAYVQTYAQLRAVVKRTVWHEFAHYFGLDHPAIEALQSKPGPGKQM